MPATRASVAPASARAGAIADIVRDSGLGDEVDVCAVLPGLVHLHLRSGLPLIRIACQDGWTTLAAIVNGRSEPWALLGSQASYANLKFAMPTDADAHRGLCQLRAELPVDPARSKGDDRSWLADVLCDMRRLLAGETGSASEPQHLGSGSDADLTSELTEALVDLEYPVEASATGEISVVVPSSIQPRRVRFVCDKNRWRVALALGTGDVLAPVEPMRRAVGLFLLRSAATVRFVRPYREPNTEVLGFDSHLPLRPTVAQLTHAIGALVTAVERYEREIESLVTEAIVSHAFLAIAGGATGSANPTTYEL